MPTLRDYLNNWLTMMHAANGPGATGGAIGGAAQSAGNQRRIDPMTGQPMAANFGKDVNLLQFTPQELQMIQVLKQKGYPDDQIQAIIVQQRQQSPMARR